MPLDEALNRSAEVRANSYDPATRRFAAVIVTPTPVRRMDATGPYDEVLTVETLQPPASLPVLDSHNTASVRAVLGRVLSTRPDGETLLAELQLSAAEDVVPVGQRIADGSLTGVSIGYAVAGWTTRKTPAGRVKTPKSWRITEVTLTSQPADPNARIRQDERTPTMPKDTQTEDRAGLIARVRAAHNLPEEWQTRMTDAGEELTDEEIRQSGRDEAAATRAANPPARIRTVGSQDDPAQVVTRRIEALACRMSGDAPSDAARAYMGEGLQDMARASVEAAGQSTRGMDRESLFRAAMHTTSDFPELLTGAGNRVLTNAYRRAESVLKTIARQRTAADFRPMSILKVGEFSKLAKVTESGEITSLSTAEAKEGYALDTFGGLFSLSRKAIINDDLGAFGRWGEMMGQAAAETEAAQLMGLLTANAGNGVKLADGVNLFNATHGNLAAAGAALDVASLSAARLAMRTQKGLDGQTPVNVVPKYLLVGPALETTAEQVLAALYAADLANVNPFSGKLTLLVEPRITGNGWYVFGDPAAAPVLEYAYLSSAPGPQLASRDGWEVLGREFRVVLDFGCGATDSRGAYRNPGV